MIQFVNRLLRISFLIFFFVCGAGQVNRLFAEGYPGEHLVSQRWNYLFSSHSAITNPSFINEENYLTLKYVFNSTLKEFQIHELSAVYPIGLYQSAGITFTSQNVGPYDETNDRYETTGKTISDNKMYFTGTYAYNLWKGLTVGANVTVGLVSFMGESTIGVGGDLGLSYKLLNHPMLGNHTIGASVQNIIFTGDDQPPRTLRASLNSKYWEDKIESGFDISVKDLGSAKENWHQDSTVKTELEFNAKLGGWIMRMVNLYGIASFSQDGIEAMGFAGGINIPSVYNGRDISFLFQYLNVLNDEDEGDLDDNASSISLYGKIDIGKHREEIYARKMAKMIDVRPNDLYTRAIELYNQGNYWDARSLFTELFVEYPDFPKNDWVSFFIGSCQENMDMGKTAEKAYQKTKEQFSRSAAVPFADLGLMRVYYRDQSYSDVEKQFNELNKLGVPDSIKFHGYYYMGQAELNQKNFSKAKQLFDLIPETHPDYPFAQHSAAVAEALQDNIDGALSALENAIQIAGKNPAQKEIINRSFVFLGYIFFEQVANEQGALAKAVTALRSVEKTSSYYPDALLGLGWTALKARQWADCDKAGTELVSIAKNPVLKAEGYLIQAYANSMNKNYQAAVAQLKNASNELASFNAPQASDLESLEAQFDLVRDEYNSLAEKSYELASARQSVVVAKSMDSLHTIQKEFQNKINQHYMSVNNFQRESFFARNVETVKGDVEYALAKFERAAGQTDVQQKDAEIKDELDDLRKQLEEEMNKGGTEGETEGGAEGETGTESKPVEESIE